MYYETEQQFKEQNGYEIEGVWYPRVTRILEIKAKPGLMAFFKEVDLYSAVEEIKQRSAEEGTLVHETIQNLLTGKSSAVPEAIRPAVLAFQSFNQEKKIIFHEEYVERRIKSLRYRYAGTVDALATVDGKFGVLDIKTSIAFYPDYNLQTAAYVMALQEFLIKRELKLVRDIQTRWILRIDQRRRCLRCGSLAREKGGRVKIRGTRGGTSSCLEHEWSDLEGDIAIREFPYVEHDKKAFIAAKTLWEWENSYWLRKIRYLS